MTERQTLNQVNQDLMDALGLGDLAHKYRSVQVSLHATSWPTARLDLVINKSGQTQRRYVRLVPEDIETEQPVVGFDIDAACDQARAVVAEAIEAATTLAKNETSIEFAAVRFPTFIFTDHYHFGVQYRTLNDMADCAFWPFEAAMTDLDDHCKSIEWAWGFDWSNPGTYRIAQICLRALKGGTQ